MSYHRITLSTFLIEERRKTPAFDPELAALIKDVEVSCKYIASAVSRGKLAEAQVSTMVNIQGEEQKPLDVIANEAVLKVCDSTEQLLGVVSEEMEGPYAVTWGRNGRYLLVYDPLDGSSNLDVNLTVGTIFSVLRAPEGAKEPKAEYFLQPGTAQVAAGFSLYGPSVMLILTVGRGVHGFTLDREVGTFILTHPDMRIPEETREFAINASNERFWEPPVRLYVEECQQGKSGPRGVDFNMRWIASMVAEVYRILIRGGLFMYPRDTKDPSKPGRLRLLYEANPMSMIVEQAGGAASTGRERILEVKPTSLHQRVPVILGSRNEVERLVSYHQAFDRGEELTFKSPLFSNRSIFRS
ncbi:fructose-1,6-bisphosphatase I / sedoheptulose-1,7-bisphosphatase [Methylacidimicrobium cyclopophantes]|uniref:Fructose-1,6-bisphosphatase class 1 n=1 Tax=Methylacidimicrobium cyclopophantes TaxID=1041766 RepID=A0A5E6M606_9BACT|nr:class 1 fructose-bisphosphatase [Methylacidimicrobium cyclopophantes]VVM04739.1 fructose-1,6-bisphosphatase I / sedoheptulose-1,7-bisphosphatase [Methylacidimicrobium cyclopophantes]